MPIPQHKRQSVRRSPRVTPDLEEIRPHYFLIRTPAMRPFLKHEGNLQGNRFELTTWRREGLFARLRAHGFMVYTLEDQIRALPQLPQAKMIGAWVRRPISAVERYSYFDTLALAWVALDARQDGMLKTVQLRVGWLTRRRRGRGASTYHQIVRERGDIAGLVPLGETEALLAGYAQATLLYRDPLQLQRHEQYLLLPEVTLPLPHHELCNRLGEQIALGWRIDEAALPLARALYKTLGLTFTEPTGL